MNTHATIHVACILAAALSAAPASAQILTWSQLAPVSSPSERINSSMAYDAARQRVVLFGGHGTTIPHVFGDTWEWDGTNWVQRVPASSPPRRSLHAMAYDEARQKVVLFGGGGILGSTLGDTWEWDGTNWTQLAPSVNPTARKQHAMAYDAARQRVVLFGGVGQPSLLADTWEWDGTNWTQSSPSTSPFARGAHAMAYDAARQRVVLFGGGGGFFPLVGDTWEWDGTNWMQSTPTMSPSGRHSHAMAYDAARQRVVLFGGWDSLNEFNDTWEWDGTNWVQLLPPTSPLALSHHAMAYDSARQRVVLFGGANSFGIFEDTWVYGTAIASATAYGAGCGSPALGFVPDANGRPVLGQTASATIVNAPTSLAAVALGWSNQFFGTVWLPASLAWTGMPGCLLWQSTDILGLGTSPLTPSTLSFSVPIPNTLSLLGSHVYIQAYAFAPGVNPLQIIISNGIDWLLGNV